MGSTRAVETQRTATTLDTGAVTTTTATSSRDHDAGSCRPPPLQPGRVRPVPVQPSLRGSQGCTDGIMLTIIMTFAIMTKRNNECDTANFHSQYVIVVFKPGIRGDRQREWDLQIFCSQKDV